MCDEKIEAQLNRSHLHTHSDLQSFRFDLEDQRISNESCGFDSFR